MKIQFIKLEEAGYKPAMLGLSLSHEQEIENMPDVAQRLKGKRDSHTKFLRLIQTWWDIWLPRELWAHFDTYKVGCEKCSGSTMFNIMKRPIRKDDFIDGDILATWLADLNIMREDGEFRRLKRHLPEGYMQRRVAVMNYQTIQHIVSDRQHHKLVEWQTDIIRPIHEQLERPELIIWE
jgi:hypothetical protein